LVGTLGGGLNILDPNTKNFTQVKFSSIGLCETVLDIYVQSSDTIWLGCINGLVKLGSGYKESAVYNADPENEASLSNSFVTSILPAKDGELWVGTFGGLNLFSMETDTFSRYVHSENDETSITHNSVVNLFKDSEDRLWVATFGGGLNLLDQETNSFTLIGSDYGIYQENIMGMIEVDNDAESSDVEIWVTTSEGIIQLFPDQKLYTLFGENNGFQGDIFNPGAVYKTASGDLAFGGTNGFNLFNPRELHFQSLRPNLTFTGFFINFEEVPITEEGVLQQPITKTENLVLPYDTQIISFEFASLDYLSGSNVVYRYMLDGFENQWIEVSSDRRYVTFTNLDPGDYSLRVQSSYGNGQWGQQEIALNIAITPPWWQTLWFIIGAVSIGVLSISGFFYYRLTAFERQKNRLESLVQERTSELKQSNRELESFTYSVSHDLRAPLRAIQGFTKIIAEEHADQLNEEGLDYFLRVENSASRMNELIDALLDLSRLSREELTLSWHNMSEIVEEEINDLKNQFPEKKIEVDITPDIVVHCDGRMLRIALHNLLENAFKYSMPKEVIKISFGKEFIDGQEVYFVKDNGIGFPEEYSEKIFEVFQRIHTDNTISGTGIGLAIVQRIIRKHGGDIWAESAVLEGSTLYFRL
ncbi:MAG TPA: ATP-binding protein, partial [Anaerolineales bacterium]|nr:ATP-binding protein [Anaerolineales bacterium]